MINLTQEQEAELIETMEAYKQELETKKQNNNIPEPEPEITEPEENEQNELTDFDFDSFFETPKNTEPNYDTNKVPLPQKRNYIIHLLDSGYTPTICQNDSKVPFYKNWQELYFYEIKEDFIKKMEVERYNFNFGIMSGLAKYNNVSCIDFDVKQFTEPEQTKLINHINNLLETEFIQSLIQSKKIFVEKSVNNGYHLVCSINDLTERKGIKLLNFYGICKPNNLIKEEHLDLGEFLETRGRKQHFVSYPSNGYTKIHNVIWELNKVSTEEYNELENFVINYFLNCSENFSRAKENNSNIVTNVNGKSPNTGNKSIIADTDQKELSNYQSKFADSSKDIEITKKLLEQNGYVLVRENGERIDYLHPLSSHSESNFTLYPNNHSITNFSGNNFDFPNLDSSKDFATYGTLRTCYILWKKINQDKQLQDFYSYLETEHNIKLVLDAREIMKNAIAKKKIDINTTKRVFTMEFVTSGREYFQLAFNKQRVFWEPKTINQICNQLGIMEPKARAQQQFYLDNERMVIKSDFTFNYVYSITPPENAYELNLEENEISYFVLSTMIKTKSNNNLWESYLSAKFGKYKDFIKQWISAYAFYSKYEYDYNRENEVPLDAKRLSSLVLMGDRGTGKGTFHTFIRDIYGLKHWNMLEPKRMSSNFDTWKMMKLDFIDESNNSYDETKELYNIIKKQGGNDMVTMEQKNQTPINIKNQTCYIIASNYDTPLFTEFSEFPESENDNQFFVIPFEKDEKYKDAIVSELRATFYNYIVTELKDVFYNEVIPTFQNENVRWIVKTPITDRQITLFESSKTNQDYLIEEFLEELKYQSYCKAKIVTDEMIMRYAEKYKKLEPHLKNLLNGKGIIKTTKKGLPKTFKRDGYTVSERVYQVDENNLPRLYKKYRVK